MRKKMVIAVSILFIFYTIYHDLSTGTLPATVSINQEEDKVSKNNNQSITKKSEDHSALTIPSTKITVVPGDTVLTIVEKIHRDSVSVPIQQIIDDFIFLNKIQPDKIQPGKTYEFPVYHDKIKE